jgi:hypothetical protein
MATGEVTSDDVKQDRELKQRTQPHDVAAFHMHGFELALEQALDKTREELDLEEPTPVRIEFTAVMKPKKNPTQILSYQARVTDASNG